MATYTLAITALADGEAANLKVNILYNDGANDLSRWETTPYSLVVEENTEVTVIAPPVHVTQDEGVPTCFKFLGWTGDGAEGDFPRNRDVTMSANFAIVANMELQDVFPTRSPTRRAAKFNAKTDEEVAAARVLALKPMMVSEQKFSTTAQTDMELKVGKYVYAQGFFAHWLHHYRNFGQAMWRLTKLYTAETLASEALETGRTWLHKGLSGYHLEQIAKLFGIAINLATEEDTVTKTVAELIADCPETLFEETPSATRSAEIIFDARLLVLATPVGAEKRVAAVLYDADEGDKLARVWLLKNNTGALLFQFYDSDADYAIPVSVPTAYIRLVVDGLKIRYFDENGKLVYSQAQNYAFGFMELEQEVLVDPDDAGTFTLTWRIW